MNKQRGFTLIEIAIVLVIIGLLLGGVLKGQELITSARVRNVVAQQDGVKAAYFGFLDRYRALPGDYSAASTNIAGIGTLCGVTPAAGNGDGDGQIETASQESILVWEHLAKSGFITGSFTCATTESTATTMSNPFGARMQVISDAAYAVPSGTATARHNLKTGPQTPSDILAEVDRKIDDGSATGGTFRFSDYAGGGAALTAADCHAAGVWTASKPAANCGGVTLF